MIKAFVMAGLLATPALAVTGPMLSTIVNPPKQIGDAAVLDDNGQPVGTVQRVEVTPDGRPTEVAVMLHDDQLLVLQAGAVRYDAASNQIITKASGAQLLQLTPN